MSALAELVGALEPLEGVLAARAKNAQRAHAAVGLALVLAEAAWEDGAMYTRGEPAGVVLAQTVEGGGRAFVYFEHVDFEGVDAYHVIDIARLGDDDGMRPYVELSEAAARRLEAVVGVLHEPLIVTPEGSTGGLWAVDLAQDPLAHVITIDGGFLDPRTQREIEACLDDGADDEIERPDHDIHDERI